MFCKSSIVSLVLGEEKEDDTEVRGRLLLTLDVTTALKMVFLWTPALDSLVMEDFHFRSSGRMVLQSMMIDDRLQYLFFNFLVLCLWNVMELQKASFDGFVVLCSGLFLTG